LDPRSNGGTTRAAAIARAAGTVRAQYPRDELILDAELAALYDVSVGALNQAVKRNRDRFPSDFIFRLTKSETDALKSQTVISNAGRGGRRTRRNAFTEQGVAMLSNVLRCDRAVRVNVEIMRTFVRLRRWIVTHKELAARLDRLGEKYRRSDHDRVSRRFARSWVRSFRRSARSDSDPVARRARR
jgi:hypothetical protein